MQWRFYGNCDYSKVLTKIIIRWSNLIENKFKGLIIVEGKIFKDNRGYLREILIEKKIKKRFKFQIVSNSKKNVLRGLHYQFKKPQGKFINVVKGKIFDVAVDLRKNSKTYGKHFSIILSEKNCKSLFIPPGFAHGFQTSGKRKHCILQLYWI